MTRPDPLAPVGGAHRISRLALLATLALAAALSATLPPPAAAQLETYDLWRPQPASPVGRA